MRWLLVLFASCVYAPLAVEHPTTGTVASECHLGPAYEGVLSWPSSSTELVCTAKNERGSPREVCFQPYVGVRQTGALYTTHDIVCTDELGEGESQTVSVRVDLRRELCQLDRGGCVIKVLTKPDPSTVVAMARGLEAQATVAGRDRPTVAECQGLVRLAPQHPDDTIAMCLGLSRAELACLAAATDAKAAEACAPRMP